MAAKPVEYSQKEAKHDSDSVEHHKKNDNAQTFFFFFSWSKTFGTLSICIRTEPIKKTVGGHLCHMTDGLTN